MRGRLLLPGLLLLAGCESTGHMGMIVKRGADPAHLLRDRTAFTELGGASAESCRFFLFGVAPFGDSDLETVVDDALRNSGGDALIDVTVSSSLYGFMPIYNFFCYTCTSVSGTAVKLEAAATR